MLPELPDFDPIDPPGYPQTLTLFADYRWRFRDLPEASARGVGWSDASSFLHWFQQERTKDIPANPGEGELGDHGVRTSHLLLRKGCAPVPGWSSLIFQSGGAKQREMNISLTDLQHQIVQHFAVLRSTDHVINSLTLLPPEDAMRVRNIRIYGLPESAMLEPKNRKVAKYFFVTRDKLTNHGWEDIKTEPCRKAQQNIATILSQYYLAPIMPSRNVQPRAHVGSSLDQLLVEFNAAARAEDTARMTAIFAAIIQRPTRGLQAAMAALSHSPAPGESEPVTTGQDLDIEIDTPRCPPQTMPPPAVPSFRSRR